MEANEWVCGRNGTSWRRRDGPKRRRLCGRVINFFFLWSQGLIKPRLSNNCTLLLVLREELCCTPRLLVAGIEPQGCGRSTTYDLRPPVALLPFFVQTKVVFFLEGFPSPRLLHMARQ